jgi:hypothetical protein
MNDTHNRDSAPADGAFRSTPLNGASTILPRHHSDGATIASNKSSAAFLKKREQRSSRLSRTIAAASLSIAFLPGLAVASEVPSREFVDLFTKTCMMRPTLPSKLSEIATGLGFVDSNAPLDTSLEGGPTIDILYFARLTRDGMTVSLSAYFSGTQGHVQVSCSIGSLEASTAGLADRLAQTIPARDRRGSLEATGNGERLRWHTGPVDRSDVLELSTFEAPSRARISLTYRAGTP